MLTALLRKKLSEKKGFTLVELMIVVSIIAILAVVAVTVYGNIQRSARDTRRRADIDAIAAAMEFNYNDATGAYIALLPAHFGSGTIPSDPNGTGNFIYCTRGSVGACVGGTDPLIAAAGGVPGAGATYRVCATLEVGGSYCRANQR